MKSASLMYRIGEIILDKKKNNIAHTFGKYLNKSSYNNTYRLTKYIAPILVIVLMGAQHVYATPTSVTQGGAYSKGYNDASCDAVLCNGHGYDPRCPVDHSSEYCSNYKDGYAVGWNASMNANGNSQSGSDVGGTTGTQSQSQVSHAEAAGFWLPFNVKHDMSLKYFQVVLNHVRPEFNLIRVCVTDTNTTRGVCHYMNTTDQEDIPLGNDITANAGIFAFPTSAFSQGDTVQICVKSIPLHEEKCVWDNKDMPQDEITRYNADMSTFEQQGKLSEKPEIFDLAPLAGSGFV